MAARKSKKPLLTLVVDTREQTPLDFSSFADDGVAAVTGTVHTGDYTILGYESSFAVERKSLDDLIGTLINGYEADTRKPLKRFNRELLRLARFDCKVVVVTCAETDIWAHRYRSLAEPKAVYNMFLSAWATYGVPFWFAGTPHGAARFVADLARHYVTAREKKWFLPTKDEMIEDMLDF